MMQILIVDDEELARIRLRRLIEQIDGCEIVGEAANGLEALDNVDRLDPDLVLLDVRMPGADGIEVAKQLASFDEPPALIFCTAYDEYALEAFDTLAQGYLLKPVQKEQLEQVILKSQRLTRAQSRVSQAAESKRRHISAKSSRGLELIALEDIFCFIADQKYVTVRYKGGEKLIDDTLKELEAEFSEAFLRVHRNALVAIDKIEALERQSDGHFHLRLKGSDFQPIVSRRHMALVRSTLEGL
jgi:two-component system response regulator AlgR